ncbi:MAG: putative NTE family protein [Chlamydiae bacterium]|nr:putative NTE family protein [Chlamydiota bacterium]
MQHFKLIFFVLMTFLLGCSSSESTIPQDPQIVVAEPLAPPIKKVKVALILGAGGSRGMAHLGVLEVLEEHGIKVDLIVGCSAGSIVGALYADNPDALAIRNILINVKSKELLDPSLFSALQSPWRPKGPVQGHLLKKFIYDKLSVDDFQDLQIPFIAVATDLLTGKLVLLRSGPIAPAILASCALPPFFTPVHLYGKLLVDGGVIDPIPVSVAREFEPEIVITVDISPELKYQMPTNLISITTRCSYISYIELSHLKAHQADVVISPKLSDSGTFDDSKNWVLYEAGKKAALEQLKEIKKRLK